MKRILSILLLFAMLLSTFSISAAAWSETVDENFSLGDVNGDGVVNASDELAMQKYLSGAGEAITRDAADIDADGNATAYDAYLLKQCLAGEKKLSDYEKDGYGKALYSFSIGGVPVEEFCIVVPADTDKNTSNLYYAADELRKTTRIATGHNMEICFGTPSTGHAINFIKLSEDSELGVEGYIYEVVDGQMNIYATRRGHMYATYEIAEDYLGYRFFTIDQTWLYKQRTLEIPDGTYMKRIPTLEFRITRQTAGHNTENFWFPRRLNGRGSSASDDEKHGTLTGAHFINAHSFGYYDRMYNGNYKYYQNAGVPAEEIEAVMFEEAIMSTLKPGVPTIQSRYTSGTNVDEYKWQPCFTSEDSYRQMFLGLLLTCKMITKEWGSHKFKMGTSAMSFSICDNVYFCQCANCCTLYATDGNAGGSVYIANRAIDDIQKYYPGLKLYFIIYEHSIPETIFPKKDLIVLYCGTACNNHYINSGECTPEGNILNGGSNIFDAASLKAWGDICRDTGAELWFWYYPVTYHYYLVGCPNIVNLYYDYKYLVEDCGVTGMFYEGGGEEYNFETLKEYLAAQLNWSPDMTEEEFFDHMQEYLYMYYGDGYADLAQFLELQDEAGNGAGCFINNFDRPRQMYDFKYIDAHYEEMRALLVAAWDKAKATGTSAQRNRVETLLRCFDFLGLSCVHYRYYKGDDAGLRETYMERYSAMYNYIKNNNMKIFSDDFTYTIPSTLSYEKDPMLQFYGEERPGVTRWP